MQSTQAAHHFNGSRRDVSSPSVGHAPKHSSFGPKVTVQPTSKPTSHSSLGSKGASQPTLRPVSHSLFGSYIPTVPAPVYHSHKPVRHTSTPSVVHVTSTPSHVAHVTNTPSRVTHLTVSGGFKGAGIAKIIMGLALFILGCALPNPICLGVGIGLMFLGSMTTAGAHYHGRRSAVV